MEKELNLNEMEQATGGAGRTVNTGMSGVNAALRAQPRKSSKQIGSISNGTQVNILSGLVYDPESGRNFVQVSANGKIGWIAASIVGLKR